MSKHAAATLDNWTGRLPEAFPEPQDASEKAPAGTPDWHSAASKRFAARGAHGGEALEALLSSMLRVSSAYCLQGPGAGAELPLDIVIEGGLGTTYVCEFKHVAPQLGVGKGAEDTSFSGLVSWQGACEIAIGDVVRVPIPEPLPIGVVLASTSASEFLPIQDICRRTSGSRYVRRYAEFSTAAAMKAELARVFEVRNRKAVGDFLSRRPALLPLLLEAPERAKRFFGTGVAFVLDVRVDRESQGPSELFIYILTEHTAHEAWKRLRELEDSWWLEAVEDRPVNLHVEFR